MRIVRDASQMASVKKGDVLVTDMTDPNWEPVMKLAAAIVTNRGGRTCHAAIIARELGIPAVVGCGDATRAPGGRRSAVTVSCAEGDTGYVYDGLLPFEVISRERGEMPRDPGEDRDERRQSRSSPSTSRSCRTPASAWRGWNSSSTTRSASIRGPASTTPSCPPT